MKKEDGIGWKLPIFIFSVVIVLWTGSYFLLSGVENRGTFGDMFGAVNSLFSGLAFAALIYTILLQRKELQLQRKELSLTRNELSGQKDQMVEHNEMIKVQQFESTFFQLLKFHTEITKDVSIENMLSPEPDTLSGRFVFKDYFNQLGREYKSISYDDERDRVDVAFQMFHNKVQAQLDHYFRSFFNLIAFVDTNSDPDKRTVYIELVCTQLSTFELLLIFYYGLSAATDDRIQSLIENYSLLRNLNTVLLFNKEEHEGLYKPIAYQKS